MQAARVHDAVQSSTAVIAHVVTELVLVLRILVRRFGR